MGSKVEQQVVWEISLHLIFINCMLPDMLCSVDIWSVYVICSEHSYVHVVASQLIGQVVAWP